MALRLQNGDEGAFAVLYRRYYASLVGYAYRITGTRDSALDVVSDVFLAVWQSRARWRPVYGVRTYFFTATRNRAFNVHRGARRAAAFGLRAKHELALVEESPEANVEREEQRAAVRQALDALPTLRREVMLLRWEHQLEVPAIARVMDISENAVRLHLSKAVRTIRTLVTGSTTA
jgi:RNA polymerase sigma-70 factor (ECF subfamily)